MSSKTGGEGEIRKRQAAPGGRCRVEADLVECMVALPGQLFTNTQIPACIWFLTKDKKARTKPGCDPKQPIRLRDRSGRCSINARNRAMKDRVARDLSQEDITRMAKAKVWACRRSNAAPSGFPLQVLAGLPAPGFPVQSLTRNAGSAFQI